MISKGLYVDVWRDGFKSREQADELIAFCYMAGITDLFIHMHKDIASVSIEWDYMRYLLDNKGPWNVHGWFSGLQLGSNNAWTRSAYPESATMESQNVLFLDPVVRKAREILVSKLEDFVSRYPDAYGLHIDKMRYPVVQGLMPGKGNDIQKQESLVDLMKSIRSISSKYKTSIVISQLMLDVQNHGLCDWKQWKQSGLIDDITVVMEMINEQVLEEKLRTIMPDYASAVVPCYMFRFVDSVRKIKLVRASGHGCCIFSYGMYGFQDKSRSEFARMISDVID